MKHVMLDTETLGRKPGCAILSIGAMIFDPYGGPLTEGGQFYSNIDLTSQIMVGLIVDPDTAQWWQKQDKNAQQALSVNTRPLHIVLEEFRAWCLQHQVSRIWCQGANFDEPIVSEAFERIGIQKPWKYNAARDTRTIYDTCNFSDKEYDAIKREGTYHNALDDAAHQIKLVQAALAKRTVIQYTIGGSGPCC